MNVSLWVAQIISPRVTRHRPGQTTMARDHCWRRARPASRCFRCRWFEFTAAMEVLAAIGLVAPWLSGIAKILTPLAAAGLCVVMIGAAWAHSRLREPWAVAANAVLFALAAFVLVGRLFG